MKHLVENENQFVVELLTNLRQERFSPFAWIRFLARSWEMSCKTAHDNPSLKVSWLRVTFLIAILAAAISLVSFFFEGQYAAFHLLPGFLFCVLWQQSDLFWHLGLNRQVQSGKLLPAIGLANTFTWLRALGASFLLGRLTGGLSTPSWLALLVFLAGMVTDILDGQVARHTGTQSKLGQIGDGEADVCLYLALTLMLIHKNILPLWLGLVMLLRFCVPMIAALASYFLFAHPVRFGSTNWGKYAGLAQCIYFLVLLAPAQVMPITQIVNLPLLIFTLMLLIAAPVAQIVENLRSARGTCT